MADTGQHEKSWVEAYRHLRADIERGQYVPGQGLPTISGLAKASGLTTYGARRVMQLLCSEGHAQSWQGKGYRVAIPHVRLHLHVRKPTFGASVRKQGFETASEVICGKTQGLPQHLARRMRRKTGTKVICTETLRKVNGRVVGLSVDYFVQDRLDGIAETLCETGSVSQALVRHKVPTYERDQTSIDTRLPTAHEALMLGIPRQQPVYATIGANLTNDGQVFQISTGTWRGDCVTYLA